MAQPTRNIVGTVIDPTGSPVAGGTIEFRLSTGTGTVPDDTTSDEYVVGGIETVKIGSDGTVNFNLVPNDQITPAGTVWITLYKFPGGATYQETWSVASGATPLQIGDVTRSNAGAVAGSAKFLMVSDYSLLPTPSASIKGCRGYVEGVSGEQDQEYVCMKGWDDAYRWVSVFQGGGP